MNIQPGQPRQGIRPAARQGGVAPGLMTFSRTVPAWAVVSLDSLIPLCCSPPAGLFYTMLP